MSQVATLSWGIVIVGGITTLATAGALLVRRWVPVEVLERHNEVKRETHLTSFARPTASSYPRRSRSEFGSLNRLQV
jgi:hypothetical protein